MNETGGVRRPQAMLLDLDDTLVDNSVIRLSVERTCNAVADAVDGVDQVALLGANLRAWKDYWPEVEQLCWVDEMDVLDVSHEVWRRALHACGHDDPSTVALAYETHQQIGRELSRLYDDVPDFLAALREVGIATALVTNASTRAQRMKIESVGLDAAFDAVVISGEVGVAKPAAAIFDIALDRLRSTRRDAWHVGDSLSTDVAGAKAAGVRSVWLNRHGRQRGPSDPFPDSEITTLRELQDHLLGETDPMGAGRRRHN